MTEFEDIYIMNSLMLFSGILTSEEERKLAVSHYINGKETNNRYQTNAFFTDSDTFIWPAEEKKRLTACIFETVIRTNEKIAKESSEQIDIHTLQDAQELFLTTYVPQLFTQINPENIQKSILENVSQRLYSLREEMTSHSTKQRSYANNPYFFYPAAVASALAIGASVITSIKWGNP